MLLLLSPLQSLDITLIQNIIVDASLSADIIDENSLYNTSRQIFVQ